MGTKEKVLTKANSSNLLRCWETPRLWGTGWKGLSSHFCFRTQNADSRDFPGCAATETPCCQGRGLGSIPGQGIRSHMPQLGVCMPQPKIPYAATRIKDLVCCN